MLIQMHYLRNHDNEKLSAGANVDEIPVHRRGYPRGNKFGRFRVVS
jgi:hypothetical protein